jgi:hypothetical protein
LVLLGLAWAWNAGRFGFDRWRRQLRGPCSLAS